MYKLGIDIGGTHTDGVLVDGSGRIAAFAKTGTTRPLEKGVLNIFGKLPLNGIALKGVYIGTTHATNAVLERKNLYPVGVIRIAGHRPDTIPPCYGWEKDLRDNILAGCITVDGGFECDGREITPFSSGQIEEALHRLLERGAESLAVSGVFSPLDDTHERQALEQIAGRLPVTLSSAIGGVGFVERENGAVLNAALRRPMEEGFQKLKQAMEEAGLQCPLFITQNDGSLITLEEALAFPLLTVSSGPTNSFIGACKLSGLSEAVIADVGGTSTDIGIVKDGYPRRSFHCANLGGVSLNFRMPDVLALPIGGGTIHGSIESVGRDLPRKGKIFGGDILTLTDLAAKAGRMIITGTNPELLKIPPEKADEALHETDAKIADGIRMMKGKERDLPVVFVGGGAPIFAPGRLLEHASVANAYGAALAEISATVETVVSLKERSGTLERLKEETMERAVGKGACAGLVRVVDIRITPYHYVPGQLARVSVTASG